MKDILTKDIEVVPKYWAKRNRCNCHPETCCCAEYVVMSDGDRIASCFDKREADELCKLLNKGK